MIALTWRAFANNDCDSFNLYRSISGFVIPFPNSLVAGDVLSFSATSPEIQNIRFSDVDIDSVVGIFNAAALGAIAVKTDAEDGVIVRLTATSDKAKLKLYECSFLTHLGVAAQTIVPRLNWALVGNEPFVTGTSDYEFDDVDGSELDSYRLTSVIGSTESLPTLIQQPQLGVDLLCSIEGRVTDMANRPVTGLVIRAQMRTPMENADEHGIDGSEVEVRTDAFGRFALFLTRDQVYLLQIPAVGYNETVIVPDGPSVNFLDLIPTLAGRFSPFEDPQ